MAARFLVADVFDGLATLETGSVDLVVTSPPFLALRSYLPADHPDKGKEIGSESTPAEFIDTLLRVTAELRRVLAPHGSICVELGDTYAGSGGGGGDYLPGGMREGQQQFAGSESSMKESNAAHWRQKNPPKTRQMPPNTAHRLNDDGTLKTDAETRRNEAKNPGYETPWTGGPGWPLAKSRTLIPSLYQIALAYGFNPLTGIESPAGQWRVRNIVTWARPNPPVGALGDKWRPATSDLIVACTSSKRYWDDLATRRHTGKTLNPRDVRHSGVKGDPNGGRDTLGPYAGNENASGAPLLDYWVIPPTGYSGAHYAVFPSELVEPCVKAMCPQRVCVTCGEPSRRIVETDYESDRGGPIAEESEWRNGRGGIEKGLSGGLGRADRARAIRLDSTLGWSDCGHNTWRPGVILDPFAGSGTTLSVATGHGHDAIGIDIDQRNAELARDRVGPFLFDEVPV